MTCCVLITPHSRSVPPGWCPLAQRPCGRPARLAAGRLVRARLLHAWAHMRAGKWMVHAPSYEGNVRPLFSRSEDSRLAAQASSWLQRYLRPGIRNGELEDEEAEALGVYLGVKTGMIPGYEGINHYLRLKTERSREKSSAAISRTFFRRVAKAIRTIKAGLARDGVHVCPVPRTKRDRLEVSAACA